MLNVNPVNHRLSEIPYIWDQILASPKAPLREIQGGRGEWTELYKRNFKKKGVYVLRSGDGTIVYVGKSGEGAKPGVPPIEGALADRILTHKNPASPVGKRLALSGIDVRDCDVQTYFEEDPHKRDRIESYGIAVFDPIGNQWRTPSPGSV
jgi:hypothetical protein